MITKNNDQVYSGNLEEKIYNLKDFMIVSSNWVFKIKTLVILSAIRTVLYEVKKPYNSIYR